MPSLYNTDVLEWSEQQANLLRRLRAGERVNASLDFENLIDEVEAVGRSELAAVSALLHQAFVHLIKVAIQPDHPAAGHWRAEIGTFLAQAEERFSPSMRQRLDLARVWRVAAREARRKGEAEGLVVRLPEDCPFGLGELLTEDADVPALVDRLRTAAP